MYIPTSASAGPQGLVASRGAVRRSNATLRPLASPSTLRRVALALALAPAFALACNNSSKREPLPPETFGLKDSDRDGTYDPGTSTKLVDRCPNVAGPIKNNGCPYGDRDGDGVFDHIDRCPDAPGNPTYTGCPDLDNDGVIGDRDRCPNEPGPKRERGCPDLDGDGVPHTADKCPELPETRNGVLDDDGCPDSIKEPDANALSELHGRELSFPGEGDGISNSTATTLDGLIQFLIAEPTLRLELAGMADLDGRDPGALEQLGRRRAEAVKRYFTERGLPADRFTTRGEAPPPTKPSERAFNNRVRITVLP